MKLSKTSFKDLSRCRRFYWLSKKSGMSRNDSKMGEMMNEMKSIIGDHALLNEDFVSVLSKQYTDIEAISAEIVKQRFGGAIKYSANTSNQQYFECDVSDLQLCCYLDIFNEQGSNIHVVEVKAITTSQFKKCKYDFEKLTYCIFQSDLDNILKLKDEIASYDMSCEVNIDKYYTQRSHLLDKNHSVGAKIYDIAFQRFVMEHSKEYNPNKYYNYYLAVLNDEYVYDGYKANDKEVYRRDHNGNEIITLVDVTQLTKEYQAIIHQDVLLTMKYIKECNDEAVQFNPMCKLNCVDQCPYFFDCFPKLEEKDSLLNLVDKQSKINYKNGCDYQTLIAEGIYNITEIDKEAYSLNNQIQYDCLVTNHTHLLKDKILIGLKQYELPRAYMDFETNPSPLPLYRGESPYTQSIFQFSLHIETEDGVLNKDFDNISYLSDGKNDCREELLKHLIEPIRRYNVNSIITYNATFERNVLKKLGLLFPNYHAELIELDHKIYDLMDIVQNSQSFYSKINYPSDIKTYNYYKNDLNGSYSLKVVLPSITGLTYEQLLVKNGSQAYTVYSLFNKMNPSEFIKAYDALLEYCKQDTYSLFMIIQELKRLCNTNELRSKS